MTEEKDKKEDKEKMLEKERLQSLSRKSHPHAWDLLAVKQKDETHSMALEYMDFLGKAKTERLFVAEATKLAAKHGFKEFSSFQQPLKAGDKVIFRNRGSSSLYHHFKFCFLP